MLTSWTDPQGEAVADARDSAPTYPAAHDARVKGCRGRSKVIATVAHSIPLSCLPCSTAPYWRRVLLLPERSSISRVQLGEDMRTGSSDSLTVHSIRRV